MATRATYQIGRTIFYCHWDGYPCGAAVRFAKMVQAKSAFSPDEIEGLERRRGGWEFAFIRGVMDAEPTESHDAHGDTEYRYTLEASKSGVLTIMVQERYGYGDAATWRQQFNGEFTRWLALMRIQYAEMIRRGQAKGIWNDANPEAEALEAIPVIVKATEPERYGFANTWYADIETARKMAAFEAAAAVKYSAPCTGGYPNPNKEIHEGRAQAWASAIEQKMEAA